MCYNGFTIKIKLFKSKRFKDGKCTYMYKNTGLSHLKERDNYITNLSGLFRLIVA